VNKRETRLDFLGKSRQESIAEIRSEGASANLGPPHLTSSSPQPLRKISLVQVTSDAQKKVSNNIIVSYHSYTPNTRRVGRYIDWLIYNGDEVIGTIGLMDTPAMQFHARDRFIGWSMKQHLKNLSKVVANYRFTLMPNAPKNSGSKVLGILVRIARREWMKKYCGEICLLETVVKRNVNGKLHNGTIYRASGWCEVGLTSGTSGTVHGLKFNGVKKNAKSENQLFYGKNLFGGSRLLVFVKPLVKDYERRLKS
jgi:hypothetical protein